MPRKPPERRNLALKTLRAARLRLLPLQLVVLLAWPSAAVPQASGGPFERGVAALNAGNFAVAESAFREALASNPKDAHAWKALGVVFAAQGMHDLSSEPFARACDLDPQEPDACYYLGRNHYLMNRFEESLKIFDRLAKQQPRDWRFANGRGLALLALGEYNPARQSFETAMRLENGRAALDEKPAVNLGSLYSKSGEPEKARDVLAKVVQESPAAARAWFELGKVQVQLGEIEAARQSLLSAVRARPNYFEAHLLLAKVFTRLGDLEQARAHQRLGMTGRP